MRKIASGVFLIIFIFAVEVIYINYRLEQKLNNIELNQQSILTKVYSLERKAAQVNNNVLQTLQKQQLIPKESHNFLLTNSNH